MLIFMMRIKKSFRISKDIQKVSPQSDYKMESLKARSGRRVDSSERDRTGCIKHAYATGEQQQNYIRADKKSLKI